MPLRAAFYYDWYPESWSQNNFDPYSNYQPSQGYYNSSDPAVIQKQIDAMEYGNISAGLVSWWGQQTPSDQRFPLLLQTAANTGFHWAVFYETGVKANLDATQMQSDLEYIHDHYAGNPSYLHINGRFVVFVYNSSKTGCAVTDQWKQADTVNAYLVLKVFSGYRSCTTQPDGWYQYSPSTAIDAQGSYSYTISPGYWKMGANPQLPRDLNQWNIDIRTMVASNAQFQLISSFNQWGDGSAIESATAWATSSGYGAYLDALHNNGVGQPPVLLGSAATPTPIPIQPSAQATQASTGGGDPVLLAAGDISSCTSPGDFATARIIEQFPNATVITLGDNAYEQGTLQQFQDCYDPAWGQFKDRTHPAIGNHEYLTPGASGYFTYFDGAAGAPGKGYYSFNLGSWHLIALNSNCSDVGGCGLNSPEVQWLKADLAANQAKCTLAYWHHPRFSSGEHGNQVQMATIWDVLYQEGADLVLSGHDHDYERFMPMDANGNPDSTTGIREFVVGTGGKNYYKFNAIEPTSQVHAADVFGVLKLTLHADSYDWQFLPQPGKTFTDSGTAMCH